MGTRTTTTVFSYISGDEGAQTMVFAVEGTSYEIDLTDKERNKLMAALNSYIDKGRKMSRTASVSTITSTRAAVKRSRKTRAEMDEIRLWARMNGYDVPDAGRIEPKIRAAYDRAHRAD